MARNQGLYRLSNGIVRIPQNSERTRGYLFVSKDQAFKSDCSNAVMLYINGMKLGVRTIDNEGRIFPKLNYPETIKLAKEVSIQYDKVTKDLKVKVI